MLSMSYKKKKKKSFLENLIQSNLISKIDIIIMEWHVGQSGYLSQLLDKSGFEYIINSTFRDFGMCYAFRR